MTTIQFYVNYQFSDEKINDNGELTEERIVELLEAFHEHKKELNICSCNL